MFISYSHRDEELRGQLETHLSVLLRQGILQPWHDRKIAPGSDIHAAIDAHLESADIILLLVSPDFLASDYCYDKEMVRALDRHRRREATVIPVILRPCEWQHAPFAHLLATPPDGRPVTSWPDRDQAFLEITKAIRSVLDSRGSVASPPKVSHVVGPQMFGMAGPAGLARDLRLPRRFTQHDKDMFVQGAFEQVAQFFENSLAELARQNPEVQQNFRRLDASRFTARVYHHGDVRARCTVFLGGLLSSNGIAFSHDDSGATNSLNETLTVEVDEEGLYFRALMSSASQRQSGKGKLTPEDGANFLWEMFIAPLWRR